MQFQQAPPDIHPASTFDGPREPIWTEQFAADPQGAYERMRQRYGTLAPVEIAAGVPATLVLGYQTAVKILNEPDRFPADPRVWQATAPADLPIMPMLEWRPTLCVPAERPMPGTARRPSPHSTGLICMRCG